MDSSSRFRIWSASLRRSTPPLILPKPCGQSGLRADALRAFLAQPYLNALPEGLKVSLAESIPSGHAGSARSVLKLLPLKRAARRALDSSSDWVVHLCSGPRKPNEPLAAWCDDQGLVMLQVDLQQSGGKGWDLSKQGGVWKVLLWAAAQGRIAAVLSSPPLSHPNPPIRICVQAMLLWSLTSVVRGTGVPYVAEHEGIPAEAAASFSRWSGVKEVSLTQGGLGDKYLRPTILATNLDLSYLSTLEPRGSSDPPPNGREWTWSLRYELSNVLAGRPSGPSCDQLDREITLGMKRLLPPSLHAKQGPTSVQATLGDSEGNCDSQEDEEEALLRAFEAESVIDSDSHDDADPSLDLDQSPLQVEEPQVPASAPENQDLPGEDPQLPSDARPKGDGVPGLSASEVEKWRAHLQNGHVPYRRDCKQCVEGAGLGLLHRRVKYPRSFALSVDLFGPAPVPEAGRDETCVTGKNVLRYGLV